ncbi:putative ionotropic glutamate receptor [Helianthus annuus]|nr:putative ionotropic glutamate receptor [Helianthus annuus]
MSSEIYMLVSAARKWNQTQVTLLRPFTIKLWIAIIIACIFIGAAVGYLEYRGRNPDFLNIPFYQKLFMIIWFPVSKFFFQEGRIHNRCSKVVLVIWLTMIFIVTQVFTACLSSWLTVNQLQPQVPKQYQKVGYQDGSFVIDFLSDHIQSFLQVDKPKKLPLSSLDDYKKVLDNRTVDAIFDELPYIEIFLAKYGDNYMKVGPLASESGLGFVSLSH